MSRPDAEVIRVAVPVPLPRLFDYLVPEEKSLPPVGSRVRVPFGRRRLVGLVVGHGRPDPSVALKPVESVLDRGLIDPNLIDLGEWCRSYYGFAPGEMVNLLLPGALRRVKPFREAPAEALELTEKGLEADLERAPRQAEIRTMLTDGPVPRSKVMQAGARADALRRMIDGGLVRAVTAARKFTPEPGPELNAEQRDALAAILRGRNRFEAFLLSGVTGSGKTEVYLQAARHLLDRGRQILILIPEIGLTAQLVRRIEARLGEPAHVYHSGLSEGERLACWQAARDGRARVIVGTRSAVFLPLARPGLIVVDEEHDGSFKQAEGARYHARDVAVVRASRSSVPVVLGSATPSLESLNNVEQDRYRLLVLSRRAGAAQMPGWRIVDARGRGAALDPELRGAIERHLEGGGQVLLHRNRRGYAPVLMCSECGWQADCQRCSAHMTWHQALGELRCHHCGASQATPPRCPDCQSPELIALGAGTERLEELLEREFAPVPVHRVDRDSMTGRHDFERVLEIAREGKPCILVGTQMLAKGHHLPGVTLAAVLDVDQALFSADFRAPERLGQIVCQVAGRAGRGERAGEFLLLTRHPEHPLLSELANGNYSTYARRLLEERRQAELPPATAMALLRAESHKPEAARRFLVDAARCLAAPGVEIHGPLPAILSRRRGYWRFQLWLQAKERATLARALAGRLGALYELPNVRQVRWHLDMDAIDL